jgi:phospholipase C
MVPATPPRSRAEGLSTVDTTNELFAGNSQYAAGPIGLGVRVPMLVISPWSKGGWVSSEVFDHTSLIRFIEERFGRQYGGIRSPNITAWRRAVVGDLTSAFNFRLPNEALVALPSTVGYVPPDNIRHPDYSPTPPSTQGLPKQEHGVRPARPVPYELHVRGEANLAEGTVQIHFENSGRSGAVFQVRSGAGQDGPWTYTVGANAHTFDTWTPGQNAYDLSVYGPNGFFRAFKGSLADDDNANLAVKATYDASVDCPGITLDIRNQGNAACKVRVSDAYGKQMIAHVVAPGRTFTWHWSLEASFGWYDLTIEVDSDASFRQQLAGHVETGADSKSDPAIGA